MSTVTEQLLELFREDFRKSKILAEKAIGQLSDDQLFENPEPESNDIAIIIHHMSGNMISRWTDFYTTDGEKEYRNRDSEFEDRKMTRGQLMDEWEKGWNVFMSVIDSMTVADLLKTVYIRKEPHTVLKAVMRQHSHYNYHIGQIVQLAKMLKGSGFTSLSIPKGESEKFNNEHK